MILRICNVPVEIITDGGSSRDLALIELTRSVGGTVEIIKDEFYYRSKVHRILRVFHLLVQVWRSPHRIVLLYYPGYPFFWKHKVTSWFLVSCLFSVALFLVTRLRGKRTIVDVVDLPLYQYRDLNLPMEMSERTFHAFDRLVFTLADEIWFASEAFSRLACREYHLNLQKTRTVLNGAFRVQPGNVTLAQRHGSLSPLRFVYAGTMNAARELDTMLAAFTALAHSDAELHLCGIEGEWIPNRYPDSRIKFHGHLSQADSLDLIRQCDIGIIPYPEQGYYNLVFPSKFPLYVSGGVMLLGSDATELARCIDAWGLGWHGPIEQLGRLLQKCVEDTPSVGAYRHETRRYAEDFYWDTIYYQALSGAFRRFGFGSLIPGSST